MNYLARAKMLDFYFDRQTIDFAIAKFNSTGDATIVKIVRYLYSSRLFA